MGPLDDWRKQFLTVQRHLSEFAVLGEARTERHHVCQLTVLPDGVNWVQVGTTVTISMSENYDIGLGVISGSNSSAATATFDNVSVTIGTTPFVTGLDPVFGNIGATVTVTGSHFGATQGS